MGYMGWDPPTDTEPFAWCNWCEKPLADAPDAEEHRECGRPEQDDAERFECPGCGVAKPLTAFHETKDKCADCAPEEEDGL